MFLAVALLFVVRFYHAFDPKVAFRFICYTSVVLVDALGVKIPLKLRRLSVIMLPKGTQKVPQGPPKGYQTGTQN